MSSNTTSGVQFAEVTVDIETGIVKATRILAVQDCGLVVSRLTAESQCYGGVIGSLNFALFEDRILDKNTGQMVNPNMEWYLLAGMSDIPHIDIRLKDQPERGVIGLGEPPTVSTAAAIALAAPLLLQPTSPENVATAVAIQMIMMCCVMADLPAERDVNRRRARIPARRDCQALQSA